MSIGATNLYSGLPGFRVRSPAGLPPDYNEFPTLPIRAQCTQTDQGCALIWKVEVESFPTVYDNPILALYSYVIYRWKALGVIFKNMNENTGAPLLGVWSLHANLFLGGQCTLALRETEWMEHWKQENPQMLPHYKYTVTVDLHCISQKECWSSKGPLEHTHSTRLCHVYILTRIVQHLPIKLRSTCFFIK